MWGQEHKHDNALTIPAKLVLVETGSRNPGAQAWQPIPFLPSQESRQISMAPPCVYILASKPNGTLYIGVTWDLTRRVWEHKNDFVEGFTKRYGVHTLVWYEAHESMEGALVREKAIKKWKRSWKIRLIEEGNSTWSDLYDEIA